MRQSQAQIGVISAPICAFYHRSLGGSSIVSVQACPLFSRSGSKVGQPHNFQHCTEIFSSLATVLILVYPKEKSFIIPCKNKECMLF